MTNSVDRDAVTARVRESGPLDLLAVSGGVGDPLEPDPDGVDRPFTGLSAYTKGCSADAGGQLNHRDRLRRRGQHSDLHQRERALPRGSLSKAALQRHGTEAGAGFRPALDNGERRAAWASVRT